MSRSNISLPLSGTNESTTSLATTIARPNESTEALIPKSSSTANKSTASTSTSTAGGAPTLPPVTKDWEKAYGELASSMGFAGGVPTLPPKKTKVKDSSSGKSKKGKKVKGDKGGAASSQTAQSSSTGSNATQGGKGTTNA